ncbi:MAG: hypothetical protein ABFD64_08495 [Armatimonadota bacterium]
MVIWTIAKTTFGEAMRKKILNVFLIVAVAMIVLSLSFTQLGFQSDMTVVKSLGLFIILLAGFIISLILCVSLIPTEVERRTLYTILSKPVNRYEFVLGKFIGGVLTLTVNIALMGIVFIIMVTVKAALSGSVSGLGSQTSSMLAMGDQAAAAIKPRIFDPSLLIGVLFIYCQFFILSAVVVFFSVFLTPTVNFFASSAVYVIGSTSAVWQSIADSKNKDISPLVKAFYWVLERVIPNFDYYNIQNKIIHPHTEARSMEVYVVMGVLKALLIVTFLMIAAVLVFDRKEV